MLIERQDNPKMLGQLQVAYRKFIKDFLDHICDSAGFNLIYLRVEVKMSHSYGIDGVIHNSAAFEFFIAYNLRFKDKTVVDISIEHPPRIASVHAKSFKILDVLLYTLVHSLLTKICYTYPIQSSEDVRNIVNMVLAIQQYVLEHAEDVSYFQNIPIIKDTAHLVVRRMFEIDDQENTTLVMEFLPQLYELRKLLLPDVEGYLKSRVHHLVYEHVNNVPYGSEIKNPHYVARLLDLIQDEGPEVMYSDSDGYVLGKLEKRSKSGEIILKWRNGKLIRTNRGADLWRRYNIWKGLVNPNG